MLVREPTRRDFLLTTGATVLLFPTLTACGPVPGDSAVIGQVPAGTPDELGVGELRVIPGTAGAIARDAGGIYAMSLICTHANCDMTKNGSVSSSEIDCACHGSRFDANGAVLRGPARQPLEHYAVTLDDTGQLIVDGNRVVGASVRLKA